MKKIIRILAVCIMILLAAVMPVNAAQTLTIRIEGTEDYSAAQEVLKYTNQIRAEAGLPALVLDEELTRNAMQRAAEIEFYFDHTRPDGTMCFDAITTGFDYAAENIAFGQPDAYQVTRGEYGWEYSPGHYRNIVNKYVKAIGIGVFYTTDGSIHWVQLFTDRVNKKCTATGKRKAVHAVTTTQTEFQMEPALKQAVIWEGETCDNSLIVHRGMDHSGMPMELIPPYVSSENPTIAQVFPDGSVIGVSEGETLIRIGLDASRYTTFKVIVLHDEDYDSFISMHRLYNPNSGEHFYTAKEKERNALIKAGWHYEGVGWYAPDTSNTPVYRLYNKYAGDHHYTMKEAERDALVAAGWNDEGIGWYSDDNQEIPLYRQYNPNAVSGSHNYTTNRKENDALVKIGWIAEGIGWYGINTEAN